jgi:hypothetical protein
MTSDFAAGFPVVCLGGAAADIDSYIGLVRNLPDDLGIAVFIINYMKNVARVLREDLPRYTKMQVKLIEEGLLIQPNHVYIIEQEREVHVLDGKFNLKAISKPTGWPDVVTVTLISLTRSWCGQIMAVILSGYDGDGADAYGQETPAIKHHPRTSKEQVSRVLRRVDSVAGSKKPIHFTQRPHRRRAMAVLVAAASERLANGFNEKGIWSPDTLFRALHVPSYRPGPLKFLNSEDHRDQ